MLLVAIGWKIAIQPDDPNYLKEDLIKFLERNHFSVVVTDEMVNYTPIIRATTASCHLQIARPYPRWIEPGSHSTYCCRHRSLVRRLSLRGLRPTAGIMDSCKLPLVQVSSRA